MGEREKNETIARYRQRKNKAETALANALKAREESEYPESWDEQIKFGQQVIDNYEQAIVDLYVLNYGATGVDRRVPIRRGRSSHTERTSSL